MDHDRRMGYLSWHSRILSDTPEARAAKGARAPQGPAAWNVLMGWWNLCLLVGLGIVWGTGAAGEGIGLRIGITLFAGVGYTMAIFIPMLITRPVPPRT